MDMIEYKFDEDRLITELKAYQDSMNKIDIIR